MMCQKLHIGRKTIHGCNQLSDVVPLGKLVVHRADAATMASTRKDVKMKRRTCLCWVDLEATGRALGYSTTRDEIGDVWWER